MKKKMIYKRILSFVLAFAMVIGLLPMGTGIKARADGGEEVTSHIEYDREHNRVILPGWDGNVNNNYRAWIINDEHPDGYEARYNVTNVDIVSGGDYLSEFRKEYKDNDENSDEYWWYYRAGNGYGRVTFRVYYTDFDGYTKNYDFDVLITTDVYMVDVWTTEGESWRMPGEAVKLSAEGRHWYMEDGEQHLETTNDSDTGLSLKWSLNSEDDPEAAYASLSSTTDNNISVNFVDASQIDNEYFVYNYDANVELFDGEERQAIGGFRIALYDHQPEIIPYHADFNSKLPIGQQISITPVQLFRSLHRAQLETDFTAETDFELHYDPNAVRIEVQDGKVDPENPGHITFSGSKRINVTRLADWDTDINLDSRFMMNDEEIFDSRTWHLRGLDYDFWYNEHDLDYWEGEGDYVTNTLEFSQELDQVEDYEVEYVAGTWDNDQWVETFDEEDGLFFVQDSGRTVAVNMAMMKELGIRDLRVEAVRVYNGDITICDHSKDFWVHYREMKVEYEREWDRDVLPGWDGSIGGSYRGRIEDKDHPNGMDFDYKVTDVEIIRGEELLEDFHKDYRDGNVDSDDYWWYYRAESYGTVEFLITFEDYYGEEDSYIFKLNIGSDVYNIYMDIESGGEEILPGEAVHFVAVGEHWHDGEDGAEDVRTTTDDPNSGMTIRWFLEGEQDADLNYAGLSSDTGTSTTFEAADEIEGNDYRYDYRVHAFLEDDDCDVVATDSRRAVIFDRGYQLIPYEADVSRQLVPGEEIYLYPGLLWRSSDEGEAHLTGAVDFEICFDPDKLSVKAGSNETINEEEGRVSWYGSTVVGVKRLNSDESEIEITARWKENGEDRDFSRRYHFDSFDYRYWVDQHDYDLWLKLDDEGNFAPGQTFESEILFTDDLYEAEPTEVKYVVGIWNNGTQEWEETFGPYDYGIYEYAEDGINLVFDLNRMVEEGIWDLRIVPMEILNGDAVLCEEQSDFWIHMKTEEIQYYYKEDRDMLPGWEDSIDGREGGRIWNEEHPDGQDFDYKVVDVAIKDGATLIEDFHKDYKDNNEESDEYWWYYRAVDHGTVVFEITYLDYYGNEQTYDYTVNIGTDVFALDIIVEEDEERRLPGETVKYRLLGRHWFENEDGSQGFTDTENPESGMTMTWELLPSYNGGEDYAELNVIDEKHAELQFADADDIREDHFRFNYDVKATLFYNGSEVADSRYGAEISDEFTTLTPYYTSFNGNMPIGDTVTITPALIVRSIHEDQLETDYTEDATFELRYDPNAALIEVEGGAVDPEDAGRIVWTGSKQVRITRLTNWDSHIGIDGYYEDGDFKISSGQGYHLNNQDYSIFFDDYNYQLGVDGNAVIELNLDNISVIDNYEDMVSINVGRDWNVKDQCFNEPVPEDCYTVQKNGSRWIITILGKAFTENDYPKNIIVIANITDEVITHTETTVYYRNFELIEDPKTVCINKGKTAKFTVEADGAGLKYQWQASTDGGVTWKNSGLTGNKTKTLSVAATEARHGYRFRCVITDVSGKTYESRAASLSVNGKDDVIIKADPESVVANENQKVTFTAAAYSATCQRITFQWQASTDGGVTWKNSGLSGNKTDVLTVDATLARDGYMFRCITKNANGDEMATEPALLTVKQCIKINAQSTSQKITKETNVKFSVNAVSLNDSNLTYKWQASTDNGATWKNSGLSGNKTNTLTVAATAARNGYRFRCVITDAEGNSVISTPAVLTVAQAGANGKITLTSITAGLNAAAGENVSFTVAAKSSTGSKLSYQWQVSTDSGKTWKPSGLTGNKTKTMKFAATSGRSGYQFRVVVTDADGNSITSDVLKFKTV